jgi:hypothetical protein
VLNFNADQKNFDPPKIKAYKLFRPLLRVCDIPNIFNGAGGTLMKTEANVNHALSEEAFQRELDRLKSSHGQRIFNAFLAAALGSIPWIGSFLRRSKHLPVMNDRSFKEGGLRSTDASLLYPYPG